VFFLVKGDSWGYSFPTGAAPPEIPQGYMKPHLPFPGLVIFVDYILYDQSRGTYTWDIDTKDTDILGNCENQAIRVFVDKIMKDCGIFALNTMYGNCL
jgi:hypothetical protein